MYKGKIITEQTVSANTNIPFTTALNTNSNTSPNTTNNTVSINTTGYYNITANLVITDAGATPITLNLIADGAVIASVTNDITASTGTVTFTLTDVERVVIAPSDSTATLSLQISTAGTIEPDSVFIIEKVR